MRFRHLPAILSLATLPFLIAAATPGAAPPSKSTPGQGAVQQARRAVASVAERYRTLQGYQLEGYAETRFSSSQGQQTSASSVRFKVSRPGKLSSEMRNEEMTSRVVSDGDSVWTSVAQLGQFTVQSLAQVRKDSDSLAFARQFDPAGDYAHILDGVKDVRPLTRDTVHTSAAGVTIGALIGASSRIGVWLTPMLEFLRPLPASSLLPVGIALFGLTPGMLLATIAFGAIWPTLLATVHGFRSVDVRLHEVARMFGFSRFAFVTKFGLPNAMPDILAGMRLSLTASLIITVVGEMLTAQSGLGTTILMAGRTFRSTDLYAGVILLGIVGFLNNSLLEFAERRLLAWRRR